MELWCVKHILQCSLVFRLGSRIRLLLCTKCSSAISNALKSTQYDDGTHSRWDDTTVDFRGTAFFCSSAASLQLFLCVPLSVTSLRLRLSFPSAYRDAHMHAFAHVCVIPFYVQRNSYSILFSSPWLQFSFILDRAPFRIAYVHVHRFICDERAHRLSILWPYVSRLYFFAFVVISFVRLVSFSLLLLLPLLPLLVCRVHFSCL